MTQGQELIHVVDLSSDRQAVLTSALASAGFIVRPSRHTVGGIGVLVRSGTADEEAVRQVVRRLAPGATYGATSVPRYVVDGYRADR